MLNYIWAGMFILSIVCAVFTGNTDNLSDGMLQGAEKAVELIIKLSGMLFFWTGIMKIAEKGGVTKLAAKIIYPVIKKLFPNLQSDSKAFTAMSMNISANLMGMGNAATPFGLNAMKELQKLNPQKDKPTDEMIIFVLLNTASIQILPATVGYLRKSYGSASPFDIMPSVWITSASALFAGLTAVLLILKFRRKK